MSFGERLRKARYDRRISQAELANELGVSANTISQYETNKRFPDQIGLQKICIYLEISSDYLLGLSDVPTVSTALTNMTNRILNCSEEQLSAINNLIDVFER